MRTSFSLVPTSGPYVWAVLWKLGNVADSVWISLLMDENEAFMSSDDSPPSGALADISRGGSAGRISIIFCSDFNRGAYDQC